MIPLNSIKGYSHQRKFSYPIQSLKGGTKRPEKQNIEQNSLYSEQDDYLRQQISKIKDSFRSVIGIAQTSSKVEQ